MVYFTRKLARFADFVFKESAGQAVAQDIESYLTLDTFDRLPYEYKKSIVIMRNEGSGNDDMSVKQILNELTDRDRRKVYYYGSVPMNLLKEEVRSRLGFQTFDEYHKWYGDIDTDHGDSVLPVVIDFNDEEFIIDGWHRFHSYVRKGLDMVPLVGIYKD